MYVDDCCRLERRWQDSGRRDHFLPASSHDVTHHRTHPGPVQAADRHARQGVPHTTVGADRAALAQRDEPPSAAGALEALLTRGGDRLPVSRRSGPDRRYDFGSHRACDLQGETLSAL